MRKWQNVIHVKARITTCRLRIRAGERRAGNKTLENATIKITEHRERRKRQASRREPLPETQEK